MKATLAQKASILSALYGFCEGQLNGAQMTAQDAATDNNEEGSTADAHARDALDILQVAIAFVGDSDMDKMLEGVNKHDSRGREDVYEALQDDEDVWSVLETLQNNYYK
jgi:hypothetical protein